MFCTWVGAGVCGDLTGGEYCLGACLLNVQKVGLTLRARLKEEKKSLFFFCFSSFCVCACVRACVCAIVHTEILCAESAWCLDERKYAKGKQSVKLIYYSHHHFKNANFKQDYLFTRCSFKQLRGENPE